MVITPKSVDSNPGLAPAGRGRSWDLWFTLGPCCLQSLQVAGAKAGTLLHSGPEAPRVAALSSHSQSFRPVALSMDHQLGLPVEAAATVNTEVAPLACMALAVDDQL